MKVIKHLMGWLSEGKKMYYIPGNHDEMIRKFAGFEMGSFCIVNKLVLELDNHKKAWIFHGDVFDVTMQHSKWLARLGAIGYDMLLIINGLVNFISEKIFKKGKLSLAQKIKSSVKSAVSSINNFEQTSADIGIMNKFDYVICGHIHQPVIRQVSNDQGSITYLNSGDWVDNITSLEYSNGEWNIYRFREDTVLNMIMLASTENAEEKELSNTQLFDNLLNEFNLMKE
jgi:UDP-2,3-diacylglucosamine pyrophosphatase LpxH